MDIRYLRCSLISVDGGWASGNNSSKITSYLFAQASKHKGGGLGLQVGASIIP